MSIAWTAAVVLLFQDAPQEPPDPVTEVEEIVVVGSREAPPPYDVLADFRTYCWDPNRFEGHAQSPNDDSLWVSLDPIESARLSVSSPARGYKLETERISLVLTVDEGPGSGARRRNTCTVTAMGGHDPHRLEGELRRLMGGGGTSRHLVIDPEKFPTLEGWRQIAWSAIPSRSDTDWRVFGAHPESFVVAVEPSFYARNRWVVTELKTRMQGDTPVSAITLTHFFKQ